LISPPRIGRRLIRLLIEVGGGMIGAWRDKSQRSMRPPPVVVGRELREDGPQVPLTEDQNAVGELGSDGQYESFSETVRPRTARRNLHDVDVRAGQDSIERGGELAGAVADEEPEGGGAVVEVHQQVAGLLGGPFSTRMARRPQDVDVAVADFQDEEDVDPLQGHGAVDVEEVHGQHGRGLRPQEPSPRRIGRPQRRRGYPPQLEDPADRGGADAMTEFEQLALDALIAPGPILPRQPLDQRGDRVVEGWATRPVRVGPLLGTRRRCHRKNVAGVTRR
jgi:hypothetical protein